MTLIQYFSRFGGSRSLGLYCAVCAMVLLLSACAHAPGWQVTEPASPDSAPQTQVQLSEINFSLLQQQQSPPGATTPEINGLLITAQSDLQYRISAGDVLGVTVWDVPQLNLPQTPAAGFADSNAVPSGFTVDAAGMIQFPYVGLIALSGLTEAQAQEKLTRAASRYYRNPKITLRVHAYRGSKVYVDGDVRNPGQVIITDIPMTLAEALARSGGINLTADSSEVTLIRQDRRIRLNLPALLKQGVSAAQLLLQAGDVVRVASREETKISVLGEVLRPAMVPMRNGRLTLNEALAESGGVLSLSADTRQIYVIRRSGESGVEAYHLNSRSPFMLALADGFELQARDIVYVDAAPLALWNRVINLIVPTLGGAQTTKSTVN